MKWELVNVRHYREWATIEHTLTGQYRILYSSKWGKTYSDYTQTLRGAKISMSKYLGFKTEWKQIK